MIKQSDDARRILDPDPFLATDGLADARAGARPGRAPSSSGGPRPHPAQESAAWAIVSPCSIGYVRSSMSTSHSTGRDDLQPGPICVGLI